MQYISLLRGINVGGHRIIKMAALRDLYTQQGCRGVVSYLQSGNVVFETPLRSCRRVQTKLEKAIAARFGFAVPVELRTRKQWTRVLAGWPFAAIDPATEGARYAVVFFAASPTARRRADLAAEIVAPERLVVVGREAYLHCPDGFAKTKLTNTFLERRLGVSMTTRNWKTVIKLAELADRDGARR